MEGFAKPRRVREDGLEYRLQVTWRTADAEDLGGCGLPLQRFAQLARGLAQLAGKQCDLLFIAGRENWRRRATARQLYRSASLRLRAARSSSCHPILPARREG